MMNTFNHMLAFAQFSGVFDDPPEREDLKKLLNLARLEEKDVGSLKTHAVLQWYQEGWFNLCYSQ
jgi:hypothetical protein